MVNIWVSPWEENLSGTGIVTGDLSEPVSRLTGGAESLDPGPDLTPAEPSCSPEKALPGWDEQGEKKDRWETQGERS